MEKKAYFIGWTYPACWDKDQRPYAELSLNNGYFNLAKDYLVDYYNLLRLDSRLFLFYKYLVSHGFVN